MTDLRGSLEEANMRVDLLIEAIRRVAVAYGLIVDRVGITGPQALMFADNMVECMDRYRECGSPE